VVAVAVVGTEIVLLLVVVDAIVVMIVLEMDMNESYLQSLGAVEEEGEMGAVEEVQQMEHREALLEVVASNDHQEVVDNDQAVQEEVEVLLQMEEEDGDVSVAVG